MGSSDRDPDRVERGIRYRSREYRGLIGQAGSEPPPNRPRRRSRAMRFWLFSFRYAVPAALVLFGAVYAIVDWPAGAEAFSLFAGAGLSILLLNVLFRIGVAGDTERDREDAARAYFDAHGRWPDEGEGPAPRA